MKHFNHHDAHSVNEAIDILKESRGKAKLNAGGTDLLGLLKDRCVPNYPETIVNMKNIAKLDYIREEKEGLRIGALTKLTAIVGSSVVKEKYGVLAEAAKSVATPQIRNMCTIGGNIAQDVRCWYYRYPEQIGGAVNCLRKGDGLCHALVGDNRYHSIFGATPLSSYPCVSACPAGTAIPSYLAKFKNGELEEAARIFIDFNPTPAITGRVCPTFCEPKCNRAGYDEPVAIRCVERSLGDYILDNANKFYRAPDTKSGKKVGIVGSGPAGLTAAYYLRRAGHEVTVYEKLAEAGGMLRYSIPAYRLPKDIVQRQISALERMGIVFTTNTTVAIKDVQNQFDAVLIATGAWKEKARSIKGNAPILSGLQFLKKVNQGDLTVPGKKVAVIGGGNVAVDVARTILRLGADPIVLYRRTIAEMPAFKDEIEKAREEGIPFRFLTLPIQAVKTSNISLTCVEMELGKFDKSGRRSVTPKEGSEFTLTVDAVITATGEEPDYSLIPSDLKKALSSGHPVAWNIQSAGDFVTGPSTVIQAIASGREAAGRINENFGCSVADIGFSPSVIYSGYEPSARITITDLPAAERVKSLVQEDRPGVASADAQKEAKRCFNCGCVAVNPSDVGVALVALDATIVTSKRQIEAARFFAPHAMASTVLDNDEVITEIQIPKVANGAQQHYLKFTLRKPIDFAIAAVAAVVVSKNGKCSAARIALGGVGPTPFRVTAAEKRLIGKALTEETASVAAEAAVEGAISLSKNDYKVQITRALVKRAITGDNV